MADAAVTTKSGRIVQVTYTDGGADWNYSTNAGYTMGMRTRAIIWYPSGANDILVVNEGGLDGPSIVQWKASGITDTKSISFGEKGVKIHPYVDFSDCTFATTTGTKIIFVLE